MAKPDFLVDLEEKGWTVVPNVISQSSCDAFAEASLQWLERFPHGFKRDDRSTWTEQHLPYSLKGGLYTRYSVNHEAFVWKIRTEPSVIKVFEQIWGTDDLIASFDGINVTLPINEQHGRTDVEPTSPWPHIDQNPRRVDHLELYQGIANLSLNGPQDGGLVVLQGSHKLHEKHFANIGGFRGANDAGPNENGYGFEKEDADWYRAQGCKEVKVCANAGDLILWDSRTVHWNASPIGERTRFISYVCYCPRSLMSQADLDKKLSIFRARKGTTHWPNMNVIPIETSKDASRPVRPDGSIDPADRDRPFTEPDETPEVLRLVGVRA